MLIVLLAQGNGVGVTFDVTRISDGNGMAIAITGMVIVFVALTLIASFIGSLPHVLRFIDPYLPAVHDHAGSPPPDEQLPSDELPIVAAIGYVLQQEVLRTASQPSSPKVPNAT
ncbi:MAG: OadG family protein [Pirellulaceae bacterium]|nr:OadG family protein [Planctomycetales bacterium]